MTRRTNQPHRLPTDTRSGRSSSLADCGPLTVSQLTALVKKAIEEALPATVHVLGQISNFKRHSSGHLYLTLKDAFSELSCVMWRSAASKLKFTPTDGLEAIATGRVEVFERSGRYQLYIRKLEPRGFGSLELAFRQLCEKLARQGLFDDRRKKPIPAYPARIAIVTSPTGAALGDMLRTIQRRYPCVDVLVHPVRVQGPEAAGQIARAIRRINAHAQRLGGVDVIIVGRGGGSLEDLWAFNEEVVARAVEASHIPIISAVGHEVDVTIADLVADVRAATPTAAAELAVPVLEEVLADVTDLGLRLTRSVRGLTELLGARLGGVVGRPTFREPLAFVHRREQMVDEATNRMHRALVERVGLHRAALDALEPVVGRIAPHAYLLRTSNNLCNAEYRLRWAGAQRWSNSARDVDRRLRRLDRVSPMHHLRRVDDRLDRLARSLPALMHQRLSLMAEQLRSWQSRLQAGSHERVLARGYSVTRTRKGRTVVRSVRQVRDCDRLITQVADGEFESEVVNLDQLELFGQSWPREN